MALICLISKKATLHVQHSFFVHFFCRCFARLQRETSRNFLVTRFMEEMSYVFSFTFFFTAAQFHPVHWWPLAFLIFSPPPQNCHVVLPTKKCLLCCLSLSLDLCCPFSGWASLACRLLSLFLCLSLPLFSKFVDVTVNLSLIVQTTRIHGNNSRFPFSTLRSNDADVQRERKKKRFNKQNNNFARASHIFVHFFAVFARLRRENA